MQNFTVTSIVIVAILVWAAPIACCEKIPESYTRSTDYYDVAGAPYLIATLVGDNEFERGEDAVLEITLQNYGILSAINGNGHLNPDDSDYDDERKLAAVEMGLELKKSAANNANFLLFAAGAPIDVASGVQEVESIEAGNIETAWFPIHIDDNAPAGVYQLRLEMRYDHILNVQVSGTPVLPNINYWNTTEQQNQTIAIIIEKEPDFEVACVSSSLQVGETGFLNITYRNTGVEVAVDAVARISDMLPFTAARNQERIGSMAPGESTTACFRVSTGRDAVPKTYSIGTEVRFKDTDGDIWIADPMQIGVLVAPGVPFSDKLRANKWWIIAVAVVLAAFWGWRAWKRWGGAGAGS